ncbi:MAG: hypothetical protein IKO06_05185, partial [Alphaproteobacteria bacterium]|nr:hypothetical protein [Alphaproteobacteria bacterium]
TDAKGNKTTTVSNIEKTGQEYSSDASKPDFGTSISDADISAATAKAESQAKNYTADKISEKADTNYSGLYNGRQMIPDTMAIACQINAEDIAKDINVLYNCVNKYITKMNAENAADQSEGAKEYTMLRYRTLLDGLAAAITKSQSVANYEETANKYADASSGTATKRDDEAAIVNTTSVLTDVINSMRELYAENLKYEAINGIAAIDPSVVLGESGSNGGSTKVTSGSSSSSSSVYKSETTIK